MLGLFQDTNDVYDAGYETGYFMARLIPVILLILLIIGIVLIVKRLRKNKKDKNV